MDTVPSYCLKSIAVFLQCIIDLKENVLRVGGGEVSVPFLQGWPFLFVSNFISTTTHVLVY